LTVPRSVTVVATAVLLTVIVPEGRVPAVTAEIVVLEAPVSVMAAVPLDPSLMVARFPETLRVPVLIAQLAAQPEKAARLRFPLIFQVPVTVFVPAVFTPEPFSNLKVTLL